jgi:hypothetical protein
MANVCPRSIAHSQQAVPNWYAWLEQAGRRAGMDPHPQPDLLLAGSSVVQQSIDVSDQLWARGWIARSIRSPLVSPGRFAPG